MTNKDIQIEKLKSICILDGRNREKVSSLTEYFSEYALIKYRIYTEISYLLFLSKKTNLFRKMTDKEKILLEQIYNKFSLEEALEIKKIEAKINHDVKAVEYYLSKKMENTSLKDICPFIHFGLTSYDINIPSYALMLRDFRKKELMPVLEKLLIELKDLVDETKDMVMLAKTHGQPALPTTMGKELAVYYQRIKKELRIMKELSIEAKLNGAVGNYNALSFTVPNIDWIAFSKEFIQSLDLEVNLVTTQIIPYESWLSLFDSIKRLNYILAGFCKDIWWYISFEYFLQKKRKQEVGSSTMSHKINPITFENAEGNLELASCVFEFFSRKLSYSRLQRDLSDSTIKRDFGLAFGFSMLAYDSILNGLERINPNPVQMEKDLDKHWEIYAEGIQTYLRSTGNNKAYELLKEKTRGRILDKKAVYDLIDGLPINPKEKQRLKIKDLSNYQGSTEELIRIALADR